MQHRILALSTGNHYAFKRYAESLGMENFIIPHIGKTSPVIERTIGLIRAIWKLPRGYDYYFCESCFYYPAIARKLGLIRGRIINVCSSPIYYNLLNKRTGVIERIILVNLLKEVDTFVCQGKYVRVLLGKLGINKPSLVTYTFINPGRKSELMAIKPQLESDTLVTIATNDWYYKGVDILLRAMKVVNAKKPEVKLKLVIRNIDLAPLKHLITENVGVTEDAVGSMKEACLYVHPARGDVFPVAPLEAMAAGIPVLTSGECGTKELISEDMVCGPDPQKLAEKILYYLNLPISERRKSSIMARKKAAELDEEKVLMAFKKDFAALGEAI